MDCNEYLERYLSADADAELTAQEAELAAAHRQECVKCRAELAELKALSNLLRRTLNVAPAPEEVKARITAILDAEDASEAFLRRGQARPQWALLRRPAALVASAVAAILLAFLLVDSRAPRFSAEFGQVAATYANLEENFVPTLTANTPWEMNANIRQHTDMRVLVWNFSAAGLEMVGARVERLPDGRDIIYTLYRGARGTLMCARFKDPALKFPRGGTLVNGMHHLYTYKGITMCVTMDGDVACFLVTRMPKAQMRQVMEKIEGMDDGVKN